jgi:putative transposase
VRLVLRLCLTLLIDRRPKQNNTASKVSFATRSDPGGRRFWREEEAFYGRAHTGILKQAELGTPIAELCREHGVSEQSFYRWKKLCGTMEPSEVRELKQLREENTKLKRIMADLSLDRAMLQDALQKTF